MPVSAPPTNHQFRLAARPSGIPDRSSWHAAEGEVPEPEQGQVLVKVLYLSLDPAMRMWMNEGRSYIPPVEIGEVMRAIGLGRIVASRDPRLAEGDTVTGLFGVQEWAVADAGEVAKIDPSLAPLPMHLSALGMTGMSAYFGLLDIGRPQAGETVVVSAAAGAVGAIVGQIAKIKGCRIVGIAGGAEKCRVLIDELGFDAAVDYKSEDVLSALQQACPDRIDVYFDNVGGEILDAALAHLAPHARVVVSGAVSQYNNSSARGPANYMALAVDRARMEGFIVTDYASRYPEAQKQIAKWIDDGAMQSREHIIEGLEAFPSALQRLFNGDHHGKLILKVADA